MPEAQCQFEERPHIRWRRAYAKGIPTLSSKLQAREIVFAWEGEGKTHRLIELARRYSRGPRHHVPTTLVVSAEAEMIIQHIFYAAVDPELRDEDEPAPNCEVIQRAVQMIYQTDKLLDVMPAGQVSTFFGEINATWRSGDRIVRFACFEDRPSLVQTGSLSDPIGHYNSTTNPTPQHLADELRNLA